MSGGLGVLGVRGLEGSRLFLSMSHGNGLDGLDEAHTMMETALE